MLHRTLFFLSVSAALAAAACGTTTHLSRRAPNEALQDLKVDVATRGNAQVSAPGKAPGAWRVGRPIRAVVAFESEGLRAVGSDHQTVVIPWSDVDTVSTRDRGRGAALGAGLGAIGGAASFAGLVVLEDNDDSFFSRGEQVQIATVGGLILGAAVGALFGLLEGYERRWVITP